MKRKFYSFRLARAIENVKQRKNAEIFTLDPSDSIKLTELSALIVERDKELEAGGVQSNRIYDRIRQLETELRLSVVSNLIGD